MFFETRSLIDQQFSRYAKLIGKQNPRVHPSLPPQNWDQACFCNQVFCRGVSNDTKVLMLVRLAGVHSLFKPERPRGNGENTLTTTLVLSVPSFSLSTASGKVFTCRNCFLKNLLATGVFFFFFLRNLCMYLAKNELC